VKLLASSKSLSSNCAFCHALTKLVLAILSGVVEVSLVGRHCDGGSMAVACGGDDPANVSQVDSRLGVAVANDIVGSGLVAGLAAK
jgi:hypothetical protein